MRCDANVNRLHMTNGFQLRTFDMGEKPQSFSSCNQQQCGSFQICNSNSYVSHQLYRAQLQLVSMLLVTCNNVQSKKSHSRLHSRATNQVLMTKLALEMINKLEHDQLRVFFCFSMKLDPARIISSSFLQYIFVNELLSRQANVKRSLSIKVDE